MNHSTTSGKICMGSQTIDFHFQDSLPVFIHAKRRKMHWAQGKNRLALRVLVLTREPKLNVSAE